MPTINTSRHIGVAKVPDEPATRHLHVVPAGESQRRPHRSAERVRADCIEIQRLIAAGGSELEIRQQLRMSRDVYAHRMRVLRRISVDPGLAWTKYLTATQRDLKVTEQLLSEALYGRDLRTEKEKKEPNSTPIMSPPDQRQAAALLALRAKIRNDIIATGQSMGVYSTLPADFHGDGDDTYRSLFARNVSPGPHADEANERPLPSGNVFAPDGSLRVEAVDPQDPAYVELLPPEGSATRSADAAD